MINIITGEINSGKTTKLIDLFHTIKKGDGFALPKIYADGNNVGQKILRLKTEEEVPFSVIQPFKKSNWEEIYQYDQFSFSMLGQIFLKELMMDILNKKEFPVFMDEIGPIELEGKGSSPFLYEVVSKEVPLYLVVRKNCLDKVIQKFDLKNYRLL